MIPPTTIEPLSINFPKGVTAAIRWTPKTRAMFFGAMCGHIHVQPLKLTIDGRAVDFRHLVLTGGTWMIQTPPTFIGPTTRVELQVYTTARVIDFIEWLRSDEAPAIVVGSRAQA